MKFRLSSLLILGVLVWAVSPAARALPDGEAATGRLIVRRYADAIVGVKCSAMLRVTVGDRVLPPNEQKIDINGTMIASVGLTVTSLSEIDPRAVFESNRSQMNTGGMPVEIGKTEFKKVRLRLADGTEIPAKIVGQDADHDLVFLVPEGAGPGKGTFSFVDLIHTPDSASVLGNYYLVSRTGEMMQRVPLVRATTLTGIIERPRRLLLISTDSYADAVGCPVFDPQGSVVGICVRYVDKGVPKGTVVIPAADIAALVPPAPQEN